MQLVRGIGHGARASAGSCNRRRRRIVTILAGATALIVGSLDPLPAVAATSAKAVKTTKKKVVTTKRAAPVATTSTLIPTAEVPVEPTTTAAASSAPAFVPTIVWRACGRAECGEMTVPLDYANPTGPTTTVEVARRKARDTANRIGVLFYNPGGPGGSAVSSVRGTGVISALPASIANRFDLIGVDPRGISGTLPITCNVSGVLPAESQAADRVFADACASTSGSKLPFVGTDSAAEDLESARRALGEEQISYLGVSYGTYLGTLYLQKYPDRVRAAVLDAAVDGNVFGIQFVDDQLRAYERALAEFTAWCQGNTQCLLNNVTPNVRTRIDEMLYIASQTGIGAERISSGALERIMVRLLGESWPALGQLLGDLSRGRTRSTRILFGSFDGDQAEGETDGSYEAIGCHDGLFPSARPEDGPDRLARFNSAAPHFLSYARYWANEAVCSVWPVPPRVRVTPKAAPAGRVLVIGNTLDVRTPIEWAQRLSAQLASPLVTFDSYLHSASFEGDPCVSAAVTSQLVDQVSPPSKFCG